MKERIFIFTFDRGSGNCYDEEIRICKAKSYNDAIQIAKNHYEKHYGKGWRFSICEPEWNDDDTAYVTSRYS